MRGMLSHRETESKKTDVRGQSADRRASLRASARQARRLAVVDAHPEGWLRFLVGALFVYLVGLRRIVIPPQPRQAFRQLRCRKGRVVRPAAEAEMEIIAFQLQ